MKTKMRSCFIIFCITSSLTDNSNAAAFDSFLLNHYDLKVNSNEASCRLVNHPNLPEDRRTLAGRGCMCDEDCIEYKDCCKDSRYYYPSHQSQPSSYHCSENAAVYLKAKCAPEWQDGRMAQLCENSIKPLESADMSLVLPISNQKSRITYGNAYCAACNYDQDMQSWQPWKMGTACGEAPYGYLKKPIVVQEPYTPPFAPNGVNNIDYDYNSYYDNNYQLNSKMNVVTGVPSFVLDINLYIYNASTPERYSTETVTFPIKIETNFPQISQSEYYTARGKRAFNNSIDFEKYANIADKIALNAKYDSYNRKFVSNFNNKDFVCEFGAVLPERSKHFTRKCVPSLVTSCPKSYKNESVKEECAIQTNIVYNHKDNKAYRNKDCARCNGEKESSVDGKPQIGRGDLSGPSAVPSSGGLTGQLSSNKFKSG